MLNAEVVIAVRCNCNYRCSYCISNNIRDNVVKFRTDLIRKLYSDIQSDFTLTTLECGAGEPTLHPQIKELLKICAPHGLVSMPSNNSVPCDRWIPSDLANHIFVRAALHEQGEVFFDSFRENILNLKNSGAHTLAVFVAHPSRFEAMRKYRDEFAKIMIEFYPSPFIGKYKGIDYPSGYTDEQKKEMGIDNSHWLNRLSIEIKNRDYFGIPCLAGYKSFYIDPKGKLCRCFYDSLNDTQILTSPAPCAVYNCGCGLLLDGINTLDDGFFNSWRCLIGYPQLPVEKKPPEEVFNEKKKAYFDLMIKYERTT